MYAGRVSHSRRNLAIFSLGISFGLATLVAPSPASAEATVEVTLKDGSGKLAEGVVTLSDAQGSAVARCEAREGRCEMPNVAGGNYTVTVKPKVGPEPKPRKVMIPPSGKVALMVATG